MRTALLRRFVPVLTLIMIGLTGGQALAGPPVTGVVRDATLTPLEGAIVSYQATAVRTTTDASGAYALPDMGAPMEIVAGLKGYYYGGVTFTGTLTGNDIILDAVPQADDPSYTLLAPETCGTCHPDQLEQWSDSPMNTNGLNTWLHDIYNGDGTAGGLGGFVYTRDSMFAKSNPASECASCHQPEVWIESPFSPMETPSDAGYPSETTIRGVSCEVCHKVAHVDVAKINFPGIFAGAVEFTRPSDQQNGQVEYGMLGDVTFTQPFFMRASYQPQLGAEVCAACHQDAADPDENHTYNGVISEPTYLEWIATPYGDINSPMYANCVDCHMLPSGETTACSILFPPLERDPQTLRSHDIRGTTPLYLENAAEVYVEATANGGVLEVSVDVTNDQTGHHLPTGVTVRNMILLVEAWRESDDLPLVSTGTQVVHDLGGIGDPAQGYYAGLPGKFFAKVNEDINGNGPTFFTDAVDIQFDNRIPALHTDSTNYTFQIPPDGGELHVQARLIYRRAFRFFVDAKGWTEDGHGEPLADIQAPHFGHLMEQADVMLPSCGPADVNGDLVVDVNDLVAVVVAWGSTDPAADVDGSGLVDVNDLVAVIVAWGPCP